MNALFIVVLVLFTSQGPIVRTVGADDFATCQNLAAPAYVQSIFDGKQIPTKAADGTPGEPATVLDAQARCLPFTQTTPAATAPTETH